MVCHVRRYVSDAYELCRPRHVKSGVSTHTGDGSPQQAPIHGPIDVHIDVTPPRRVHATQGNDAGSWRSNAGSQTVVSYCGGCGEMDRCHMQ